MNINDSTTLRQMHGTGCDIAAVFAGAIPSESVMPMIRALLDLVENAGAGAPECKLMLLGALAALGQEAVVTEQIDDMNAS